MLLYFQLAFSYMSQMLPSLQRIHRPQHRVQLIFDTLMNKQKYVYKPMYIMLQLSCFTWNKLYYSSQYGHVKRETATVLYACKATVRKLDKFSILFVFMVYRIVQCSMGYLKESSTSTNNIENSHYCKCASILLSTSRKTR